MPLPTYNLLVNIFPPVDCLGVAQRSEPVLTRYIPEWTTLEWWIGSSPTCLSSLTDSWHLVDLACWQTPTNKPWPSHPIQDGETLHRAKSTTVHCAGPQIVGSHHGNPRWLPPHPMDKFCCTGTSEVMWSRLVQTWTCIQCIRQTGENGLYPPPSSLGFPPGPNNRANLTSRNPHTE